MFGLTSTVWNRTGWRAGGVRCCRGCCCLPCSSPSISPFSSVNTTVPDLLSSQMQLRGETVDGRIPVTKAGMYPPWTISKSSSNWNAWSLSRLSSLGQNPYVQGRALVVLGSICIRLQIKGEKRPIDWCAGVLPSSDFAPSLWRLTFCLFVFVQFVGTWNQQMSLHFKTDVWKMILSFFKDATFWCTMFVSGKGYPEVFCTDVFACESGTCFPSFGGMIAGRVLTERVCHWVLTHTGIRTRFLQDIQEIFVLC